MVGHSASNIIILFRPRTVRKISRLKTSHPFDDTTRQSSILPSSLCDRRVPRTKGQDDGWLNADDNWKFRFDKGRDVEHGDSDNTNTSPQTRIRFIWQCSRWLALKGYHLMTSNVKQRECWVLLIERFITGPITRMMCLEWRVVATLMKSFVSGTVESLKLFCFHKTWTCVPVIIALLD